MAYKKKHAYESKKERKRKPPPGMPVLKQPCSASTTTNNTRFKNASQSFTVEVAHYIASPVHSS